MPQQSSKRFGQPRVNFPQLSDTHEEYSPTPINQTGQGISNLNTPMSTDPVEYNHDYYSGSTARVFFEDIWVDDIINLQWNSSQQKSPIYGYASQFFDAVANGTFIIQGSFSVAFKEAGYLYTIINKLRNKNSDKEIMQAVNDARRDNSRLSTLLESTSAYGRVSKTNRTEYLTIEDWLGTDLEGTSNFENVASSLEDVLWGVDDYDILDSDTPAGAVRQQKRIPRADELDRTENPFHVGRIGKGFDILITYGDVNDGPANHTIKTLSGVHLTGSSQTLAPTGDPIIEVYSFFARSLDDRNTRRNRNV